MDARDTLSALARQIALAFQPLADAFSSAGALRDFLEEFGWDFTAVPPPLDAVRAPVQDLYALADRPTSASVNCNAGLSFSAPETAPASVTSSPSRTHVMPSATIASE